MDTGIIKQLQDAKAKLQRDTEKINAAIEVLTSMEVNRPIENKPAKKKAAPPPDKKKVDMEPRRRWGQGVNFELVPSEKPVVTKTTTTTGKTRYKNLVKAVRYALKDGPKSIDQLQAAILASTGTVGEHVRVPKTLLVSTVNTAIYNGQLVNLRPRVYGGALYAINHPKYQ